MTELRPYNRGHTFTAVGDPGKQPKDRGGGRVCGECGSGLSRYNKGPNCYQHTERKVGRNYAAARGKKHGNS